MTERICCCHVRKGETPVWDFLFLAVYAQEGKNTRQAEQYGNGDCNDGLDGMKTPVPEMENELAMLRVCVIGLGPIGNLHADIYQSISRSEGLADLAGVCDVNPERARQSGERLGVPWFTDAAQC